MQNGKRDCFVLIPVQAFYKSKNSFFHLNFPNSFKGISKYLVLWNKIMRHFSHLAHILLLLFLDLQFALLWK